MLRAHESPARIAAGARGIVALFNITGDPGERAGLHSPRTDGRGVAVSSPQRLDDQAIGHVVAWTGEEFSTLRLSGGGHRGDLTFQPLVVVE